MMERVLTNKLMRAIKHYSCDACYWWIHDGFEVDDCETSEQRLIVEAARADNWKILPGQKYLKIVSLIEGELTTYRARPDMHQVLLEVERRLGTRNIHCIQTQGKENKPMSTYIELMEQAKALMVQAERARQDELSGVISDIKQKMLQYGITAADLGRTKIIGKSKSVTPAKYRGPNGELWGGGPGRKPEWVRAVLVEGKNVENYRI